MIEINGERRFVGATLYEYWVYTGHDAMYDDRHACSWDAAAGEPHSCRVADLNHQSGRAYEVDATPEAVDAYVSWLADRLRVCDARLARHEAEQAARIAVPVEQYQRLRQEVGPVESEIETYMKLLATRSFRSELRRSLAEQVRAWLAGDSEYDHPLSPRQHEIVTRYERPDYYGTDRGEHGVIRKGRSQLLYHVPGALVTRAAAMARGTDSAKEAA